MKNVLLALMLLWAAPAQASPAQTNAAQASSAQTDAAQASPALADKPAVPDAGNAVGTILAAEGLATLSMPGAKPVMAKTGMAVHPGDLLATGPRARLYVRMIDDGELTLGERAQLSIDRYEFYGDGNAGNRAAYTVDKGPFMYVGGGVGRRVAIALPMGALDVREEKKPVRIWGGPLDTYYGVVSASGQLAVSTNTGRVTMGDGQGTLLRDKGEAPGPVATWKPEQMAKAGTSVMLKNPAAVGPRLQENKAVQATYRERHRAYLDARDAIDGAQDAQAQTTENPKPAAQAAKPDTPAQTEKKKPETAKPSPAAEKPVPSASVEKPVQAATPAQPKAPEKPSLKSSTSVEAKPRAPLSATPLSATPTAPTKVSPTRPTPVKPVAVKPVTPGFQPRDMKDRPVVTSQPLKSKGTTQAQDLKAKAE